jgi:hypothetical protein
VRRSAKAKYGQQLLTSLDTVVEHILLDSQHKDLGLMSAVGEAWLFSLADAHIISKTSSFGKLGALLAAQWDSGRPCCCASAAAARGCGASLLVCLRSDCCAATAARQLGCAATAARQLLRGNCCAAAACCTAPSAPWLRSTP